MSSLLEQVVEDLRSLSREKQDRAAEVLQAFRRRASATVIDATCLVLSA